MRTRIVVAITVVCAVICMAANVAPAEDAVHLKLDKSTPAADETVAESPTKIVLDFSQKPELAVSRLSVTSAHLKAKLGELAFDDEDDSILFAVVEEPLADGAYTASWTTSSGDGHPIRGEFSFTVKSADDS